MSETADQGPSIGIRIIGRIGARGNGVAGFGGEIGATNARRVRATGVVESAFADQAAEVVDGIA